MASDKDFKRLVRSRMHKTGEAYTTARAAVLRKPARRSSRRAEATSRGEPVSPPASEAAPSGPYETLAA